MKNHCCSTSFNKYNKNKTLEVNDIQRQLARRLDDYDSSSSSDDDGLEERNNELIMVLDFGDVSFLNTNLEEKILYNKHDCIDTEMITRKYRKMYITYYKKGFSRKAGGIIASIGS